MLIVKGMVQGGLAVVAVMTAIAAAAPSAAAQIGYRLSQCLDEIDPDRRLELCRLHATTAGSGSEADRIVSAIEAARLLAARGDFIEADDLLGHQDAFEYPQVYEALGHVWYEAEDLILADLYFGLAVEDGHDMAPESLPRMAQAAYALADDLYRGQSLPEAALAEYERALIYDPDHWPSRTDRAQILEELGSHDEALADLDHVLGLNLDEPPWRIASFHGQRARVREALADRDGAITDYARAAELNPHHRPYRLALARLEAEE